MDFSFDAEQQAIRDLAARIFAERTSDERLAALEASGEWYDSQLWSELARANLTALSLPAEVGGAGCGLLEACLVLEEAGRHLAPVPLLPTLLLAGLPIARFGGPEQRERWLTPVAAGEAVLSAAFVEEGGVDPARPRAQARRSDGGWRLDGVKVAVPAAHLAAAILVPARTPDGGVGVFLLEPHTAGAKLERQLTTNREPHSRLALGGARVPDAALLAGGDTGEALVCWTWLRASLGLCALQLGVAEEALSRAADYARERRQFGRPIGSFQGVQLRVADAFVDVDAMRSTLWQAAWRIDAGLRAEREVIAARWWACRGGHRVTHTVQHLHGGVGADVAYPIHRFLLWAKQIEVALGGASRQLAELGARVVSEPLRDE